MRTALEEKQSQAPASQASVRRAPSLRFQPRDKRYYFDVGIGSVCLSGKDTGGAYCLLEVGLAPGMAVTVEVKTGSRHILSYLLSPLLRYRQEALHER